MADLTLTKIQVEYEKILKEIGRVNQICFMQEDEIIYLRQSLDDIVETCNSQAYQIHDIQQRITQAQEKNNDKLKENVRKEFEREPPLPKCNGSFESIPIKERKELSENEIDSFMGDICSNRKFKRLVTMRQDEEKFIDRTELHSKEKEFTEELRNENEILTHDVKMLKFKVDELQEEIDEKRKTPFDLLNEE